MSILDNANDLLTHFNLTENPFVLTPDPKYLYLAEKHRVVLGHLLYGIRDNKGFMVVVGEVGTGKTTLCRVFINHLLKENIEVGLICNPALTDIELLQAINQEFKVNADDNSKIRLINELNEFLLRVNGEKRKVVLIIDEAQNLHPEVMEQLRLISNLETETGKLIQIILVGQPELDRTLSTKELRQLDQRIAVRGLLGPFTSKETAAYIRHRITIATHTDHSGVIFTHAACRKIHRLCHSGVPRLINLLADRSLLVAYATGKNPIDAAIVKMAYRDMESSRYRTRAARMRLFWQIPALVSILGFGILGWQHREMFNTNIFNDLNAKIESSPTTVIGSIQTPHPTESTISESTASKSMLADKPRPAELSQTTTQKSVAMPSSNELPSPIEIVEVLQDQDQVQDQMTNPVLVRPTNELTSAIPAINKVIVTSQSVLKEDIIVAAPLPATAHTLPLPKAATIAVAANNNEIPVHIASLETYATSMQSAPSNISDIPDNIHMPSLPTSSNNANTSRPLLPVKTANQSRRSTIAMPPSSIDWTNAENWNTAMQTVLTLWQFKVANLEVPIGQLPKPAIADGFKLYEVNGSFTRLKLLNYPAIVELVGQDNKSIYMVVSELAGDRIILQTPSQNNGKTSLSFADFMHLWYGRAFIVWKDFESLPWVINQETGPIAITWLQKNLKSFNLFTGTETGIYDSNTIRAVTAFQRKNNLLVDGITGPQTKMLLYARLEAYPKPTLFCCQ